MTINGCGLFNFYSQLIPTQNLCFISTVMLFIHFFFFCLLILTFWWWNLNFSDREEEKIFQILENCQKAVECCEKDVSAPGTSADWVSWCAVTELYAHCCQLTRRWLCLLHSHKCEFLFLGSVLFAVTKITSWPVTWWARGCLSYRTWKFVRAFDVYAHITNSMEQSPCWEAEKS
jgi:hypothetical protein